MGYKLSILALCVCAVAEQAFGMRSDGKIEVSTRFVQVDVDGEQYNLNLKNRPQDIIDVNTPVWSVKHAEDHYNFTEVTDESYIDGIFFDDAEFMATLLATYSDDKTQILYDGVLGVGRRTHSLVSYPEKWWKPVPLPDKRYKQESFKTRSSYVPVQKSSKIEESRSVLHPKIVVVVDYHLFQTLGKDIQKTVKYVATFWSAIDLRYSKLYSPYVKTLVTGIVIVEDENTNLLEEARDYFAEQFIIDTKFTNYDSAFIMTTSNSEIIKGETHLGSICNRKYSTAFVKDDATFGGLLMATHELGHLLNLPHDGFDRAIYCKVESEKYSTVMAASIADADIIGWSICSRFILNEFSKTDDAQCLETTYRYE